MPQNNDRHSNDDFLDQEGSLQRNDSDAPEPPPNWRTDVRNYDSEQNESSYETPGQILPANQQQPQEELPYKQSDAYIGRTYVRLTGEEFVIFESARKLISISQICAIVSLFIGGVVLSTAAIVLAAMGFSKLNVLASTRRNDLNTYRALRRSGIVSIILALVALAVNAISLIFLYPMIMQAVQSGDYMNMFQGASGSAGSASTWG